MNSLSEIQDTSVGELQSIATNISRYLETENEDSLSSALFRIRGKPSLLSRLFPTEYEKVANELAIQKLDRIHRSKEKLLGVYVNIELEIARKKGDALISATGTHMQERLAAFATEKLDSLTQTIDKRRSDFFNRMKSQFEEVKHYEDMPELAEPLKKSLNHEITVFIKSMEKLLDSFSAALDKTYL